MTDTPDKTEICPSCGKPLPEDAPAGACPHCLLAAGLEAGPAPDGGPTPEVTEIADRFPALEVLEVLGRGGMGIVYKARQKNLDRIVALKVVAPLEGDQAAFAERFSREARTMARLDHPHIVKVYDFGETDGLFYLVMEYVEGVNLRQAMHARQLEPQTALAIVPQVCDALQYAHDQGVVHRDIKPENILLDQAGSVKIADFGLAKLLNPAVSDHTITNTGQVMGTFQYMAPEQYRTPGEVDHRADIFSLGVVFYEMLTGELPVGRFARPSERVSVDVRLDEVVLRTLEQERELRYQHASEIRTRIDSIAGDPPAAPPPIDPQLDDGYYEDEDREPPRTSRMAVAGGLAVPGVLVLGLLVVVAMRFLMPENAPVAIFGILSIAALGGMAVGFVLSLVSWIRIGASDGRLRGLGYAITGTILPVLLGLFLVPLLLFVMMPVAEPLEEPWMVPDEIGIGLSEPEPAPWPEPTAESNAGRVVMVGRLSPLEHAQVRKAVTARMLLLIESLDGEPLDRVDILRLYGADTEELVGPSADPRDLVLLRTENRTGLPLFPHRILPMPLEDYRITQIEVAPDGTTAKVTAWARPRHVLRFGMIKQQGDWWFAFGPVELE